jgi:hypothetical protein
LPNVSEPDEATIYLVPASDGSSGNLYDEYVYVADAWEKFGSGGVSNDLPITYEKGATLEFEDIMNVDLNSVTSEEEFLAAATDVKIEDITQFEDVTSATLKIGNNTYPVQAHF